MAKKEYSDLPLLTAAALNGTELVCIADVDTTTITAATISADTADNSFNDSGSGFGAYKIGQKISVSGFANAGINGTFTVDSATASKITVEETLFTDEAAGATVTIAVKPESYRLPMSAVADYVTLAQGNLADTVHAATNDLDASDGGIQTYTMAANTTFTVTMDEGQRIVLHLSGGDTYAATWPAMTWVGGTAPTLTAADVIEIWKVGSTIYGHHIGSTA